MADPRNMRGPSFFLGALMIIAVIGAVVGTSRDPADSRMGDAEPVAVRSLIWSGDLQRGGELLDETTGEALAVFEEEGEGLIRNALRSIQSTRRMERLEVVAPVQVIRWDTGRVTLSDMSIDKHIPLNSFGPTATPGLQALFAVVAEPENP